MDDEMKLRREKNSGVPRRAGGDDEGRMAVASCVTAERTLLLERIISCCSMSLVRGSIKFDLKKNVTNDKN